MSRRRKPQNQQVQDFQDDTLCLSCRFKAQSEAALKQRQMEDETFPAPYSGHMTGMYEGNVIVSTFENDKQIGFLAVHASQVFAVTERMNTAGQAYIVAQQSAAEDAIKLAALRAAQPPRPPVNSNEEDLPFE